MLRVTVTDATHAGPELMRVLATSGVNVARFERVRPTLEDMFLRLIPTRDESLRVLLVKELTEQWRTGRLLVVAVIFLIFGLTSPILAKYTPDIVKLAASSVAIHVPTPTMKDAVVQLVKNLSQLGALVAILLTMGTVAGEKESGRPPSSSSSRSAAWPSWQPSSAASR